ncbi:hypothetical protein DPMN_115857 [Dreissena polymorpha]|uniref:Uncharacterized protein n=1 Tax=Dreissena polymorpha TaxID=45954 RepID=A0A9D4KLZ4_DREPO|nr:hypothetical protein DPMN_115857 [Dreissena polymorpha]
MSVIQPGCLDGYSLGMNFVFDRCPITVLELSIEKRRSLLVSPRQQPHTFLGG